MKTNGAVCLAIMAFGVVLAVACVVFATCMVLRPVRAAAYTGFAHVPLDATYSRVLHPSNERHTHASAGLTEITKETDHPDAHHRTRDDNDEMDDDGHEARRMLLERLADKEEENTPALATDHIQGRSVLDIAVAMHDHPDAIKPPLQRLWRNRDFIRGDPPVPTEERDFLMFSKEMACIRPYLHGSAAVDVPTKGLDFEDGRAAIIYSTEPNIASRN